MMQLIARCCREEVEQLSTLMEECGALSITLTDEFDDPILEPAKGSNPLWANVILQALFSDQEMAVNAKKHFSAQYPHLSVAIESIPEQDWERACMDEFKPQQFGSRLWICPSWHTPPAPDAVNIILDPGLAFGTGTHATTSLCLTWLEQNKLDDLTVVDYGCGSGILAIAALKLGAKKTYAIDIDEQALLATENNALTNGITTQLTIGTPELSPLPVDLVIANILLTPLISLKHHFHTLLKTEGLLVVSGLLAEQMPTLIDAYQTHFVPVSSEVLGDWALLSFKKC